MVLLNSFFPWKRGSSTWLMIPKRALGSADAMSNFRELLARHLTSSTWSELRKPDFIQRQMLFVRKPVPSRDDDRQE